MSKKNQLVPWNVLTVNAITSCYHYLVDIISRGFLRRKHTERRPWDRRGL